MSSLPHEIERKYLIKGLPTELRDWPSQEIRQGYVLVGADGSEVRLRQAGERFFETFKGGGDLVRSEVEIELLPHQFEALWPLTEDKRLDKTRYRVEDQGQVIEIDVYCGDLSGLAVAEVEFATVAESRSFQPPDWFGREVTGDTAYRNQTLASSKGLSSLE